jgi:hypothetical protein
MIALPVAFMFAAVGMGRYPVFERTVLVGVPAAALFIAHGVVNVGRLAGRSAAPVVTGVLAVLVVAYPVRAAVDGIGAPQGIDQGVKPLVTELVRAWQPGDALYVHYATQYAFRYYAECGCIDATSDAGDPPLSFARRRTSGPSLWHAALLSVPPSFYVGERHPPGDWSAYLDEVDRLRDRRRLWILSSHWESPEERQFLTEQLPAHLDRLGTRRRSLSEGSGRLLLYELDRRS